MDETKKKTRKNKTKRSDHIRSKEDTFNKNLEDLFDAAQAKALEIITIEDK